MAAAIRPQSYGSSTTGVKKSVGGDQRVAAGGADHRRVVPDVQADQQLAGRVGGPRPTRPATASSSSPGGILQAQPPPCAYEVSRSSRAIVPAEAYGRLVAPTVFKIARGPLSGPGGFDSPPPPPLGAARPTRRGGPRATCPRRWCPRRRPPRAGGGAGGHQGHNDSCSRRASVPVTYRFGSFGPPRSRYGDRVGCIAAPVGGRVSWPATRRSPMWGRAGSRSRTSTIRRSSSRTGRG